MNIIVVGCGKIGTTIIQSLVNEEHNVTVIDNNPEVISRITNIFDIMGVCGNGADCEVLTEANVSSSSLVVATTNSDEVNMLCCFLAKKLGTKNSIARIRNPEYNDSSLNFMKQQLDISLAINPEMLAARELFNILKLPSAIKIETFSVRNFEMIELKLKIILFLMGLFYLNSETNIKHHF